MGRRGVVGSLEKTKNIISRDSKHDFMVVQLLVIPTYRRKCVVYGME
jgi:hypothetical protein